MTQHRQRYLALLAIGVLVALALAPLQPVFGGAVWVLPLVIGLLSAGGVVSLAAWRGWGLFASCAIALVFYLVVGGWFGLSDNLAAGLLPTATSISWLLESSVTVWSNLATVPLPVGPDGGFRLAIFMAAGVAMFAGGWLVLRCQGRQRAWALLGPLAAWAISITECSVIALRPQVVGLVWALAALMFLTWCLGALQRRRLVALILVMVALAGGGMAAGTSGPPRHALREQLDPPITLQQSTSPLASYRRYVKTWRDTALLQVNNWLPGWPIRLVAMDSYDGEVWNVADDAASSHYQRIGKQVPSSHLGPVQEIQFQLREHQSIWLYMVGEVVGVDLSGPQAQRWHELFRFNPQTNTGAIPDGVPSGLNYTVRSRLLDLPTDEQISKASVEAISQSELPELPSVIQIAAAQYAMAATTDGAVALALEAGLRQDGYFSHGQTTDQAYGFPSLAGHGLDRISRLLGDMPMVGDAEQYASAMALMARCLGLPARVVMGFAPEGRSPTIADRPATQNLVFSGQDMQAWVEIPFQGLGWVPFFPTPEPAKVPQREQERSEPEPQPQVLQPHPQQTRPAQLPDEDREAVETRQGQEQLAEEQTNDPSQPIWLSVLAVGGALLWLLIAASYLCKVFRRRWRRRRGSDLSKIEAAWREVTDQIRDLGPSRLHQLTPGLLRGATRRETALLLAIGSQPETELPDWTAAWLNGQIDSPNGIGTGLDAANLAENNPIVKLALEVDRIVFGAGQPTDQDTAMTWQLSDQARRQLGRNVTLVRRIWAAISPQSLVGH
ncbi:MAG: hypothetical protein LBG70_00010 [Bifidobacteriaceae bacterium]|jgi:hypothetical protein|nr:hypothetical protein [Bifidobacteriaceae bacterium]